MLNIFIIIVTISGFIKIMGNDLKHLAIDLKEIKNTLKETVEHYHKLEKNFIRMETRCKMQHKNK
jgi:hypothetical protein